MRMKAFLVNGVFMFAAIASLTSIFIGISDAQVVAVASFNDPRCAGQMVCSNDSLLFTCTVTDSTSALAEVKLPSGVAVQVTSGNMVQVVGATSLPDGVTVQSNDSVVVGGLVDYTLTLAIERASLLGGNPVICDARTVSMLTDEASCPIATDPPGPPESLRQNVSANFERSAVVQWESPAMTGGNGVTISDYRVTVDGGMTQTVSHDDSGGVFTATITVSELNTSYSVSVTAINSCGLSSQPATTTVSIEARPPPQRELLVQMSCDTVLAGGRPISINWTEADREVGVIYPGEELVLGELTSLRGTMELVCSNVTGCDFNISESGNYTVSLKVTNDVGSFMAMTTFSSEILFSDETLNSLPPRVNITVNRACATDGEPFQITVRFGVTTAGGSCLYRGGIETVNSSANGNIFSSNIIPKTGQSFCYMANLTIGTNFASLNGSGDITPTAPPTPDPNPPIGPIIGGVVAAVVLIILVVAFVSIVRFFFVSKNKRQKESQEIPLRSRQDPGSPAPDPEGGPMYQEADSIPRTAHPETGELYTNVSKPRNTEQAPTSIEHHEGPSGDLYAMPQTSGKKEKKKGKGREEEAEQQELAEEEKAALYSVPDKKGQKAKSQGLNYSELAFQSSAKPAPPSQGSYYADIKLDK